MANVRLLVIALCIGSNFQVNAQFGSMFGIGDIVRDIGGEVHHVWERFFKEPDERYVKEQVKKIEQIKNNLKANGKSLDNSEELTKLILQQLGDTDDKSRDLDERLVRLNDTFTLVDLKIDIVTSRINEISMLISDIPATVAERASFLLSGFLNRIRVQRNLIEVKELFKTYTRTIDINYNNFLLYTKPGANVRRESMLEFCDNLLSPYADELSKTLVRIHKLLAPGETESIYDGLLEFLRDFQSKQTFDERCDLETSFQEQFRELYHIILVSEIRAFTMQAFAMNYRHMVGEETEAAVKGEVGMMVESLLKRISSYLAAMKGTMDGVSRELFRCEPQKHLLGEFIYKNHLGI
ncbi:hypothetical protein G9C98_000272 [Cotesia typhae]|uniref:Secreted protein n=1 Tax=Cotesia typhae TaxID=2053667 RepID=A0A8J5US26_9HYME|nr:hypothetical protein G9C98_000272 [Cotesia typhae]